MIDSHCHLNDEKMLPQLEEEIKEAKKNGVNRFLVVGWDVESSKTAIEIAHRYDGVDVAVGIHPENIEGCTIDSIKKIEELAKDPKVVAIGEIGLDYYWNKEKDIHERQKEFFIEQIKLANKLNLPISIHAREASEDTYEILEANPVNRKGVLHCYSGSPEMMVRFDKLGFYFGFDGPITYKNAENPRKCVEFCPLDKILSETDSPYLTPVPHRGKPNSPRYIPFIVSKIAEIKKLSIDETKSQISKNYSKLFHGEHND